MLSPGNSETFRNPAGFRAEFASGFIFFLPPLRARCVLMNSDEKKQLAESVFPLAVLKAMTPAAVLSVSQAARMTGLIPIRGYPFRVGRESRVKITDGSIERRERVSEIENEFSNDLYLLDTGQLLNISREHFQIDTYKERYFVYDRGSACGTRINGQLVGGDGDSLELKDGDIITVGVLDSPYRFQFISFDEFAITEKGAFGR